MDDIFSPHTAALNPLRCNESVNVVHYYVFSFSKKPEIEAGNWSYITRRILIIPCPLQFVET